MWLKQIKRRFANWLSSGEYNQLWHQVQACSQAAHGVVINPGHPGHCDASDEVSALHIVAVKTTYEKIQAEAKFAEVVKLWNHINANINTNPEKN